MKGNLCAKIGQTDDSNRFLHFIDCVGIWSINPYRLCQHRCLYCIADSQGESSPWHSAGAVIPALRSQLADISAENELFVGSLVDAYPAIERGLGITRLILRELVDQGRPCCITTKSDLIIRDIDLLREHPGHCDVVFSLCSLDDDSLWVLEPGAPSANERLDAIRLLSSAGIDVQIEASPWIPGVSDARVIIANRPEGVSVTFAPLDVRHLGGAMILLGKNYTQKKINSEYLHARDTLGEIDGVIWKDPPSIS